METKTKKYRKQHNDIQKCAKFLAGKLDANKLGKDAREVASILRNLAGLLQTHLDLEDKSLFPRLFRSKDSEVSALARKLSDEMGGIAKIFHDYCGRWDDSIKIQNSPVEFIRQTKEIVAVLASRIEREDSELYPLYDRAIT